ncbi:hypothetical protein CSPX01_12149 [Colletotrichum filicis]|nr:hypothetical protein CSPX01_12149 [Colletotrichum filicis]
MSNARARSEAAILGIDWGSTAIRATICIRKTKELHPVWNHGAVPGHDIRYQTGAFNSTLYVDDRGGIVYTGEVYNQSCTPIPSKWFLCEDRETGNPLLDGLLAKFRGMEKRIRRALEAIVRTVFQEVTTFCTDRALHIDEIGLSHPAHWTAQELSNYENLIAAVMMESNTFTKAHGRIKLHVESLASAHFLFSSPRHMKQILTKVDEPCHLVFLDFGGHTMNGCIFSAVRRSGDELHYFQVGEPFTAHGGTQLWEKRVDDFATNYVEKSFKSTLLPSQRADLLEMFHLKIKRLQTGLFASMVLHAEDPDNHGSISVHLRATDARQCFLDGLETPLRLARKKIDAAVALGSNVKIVLSGGSGKNVLVQANLQQVCAQLKIDEPFLFYEAVGEKDSFNISKGAALAAVDNIMAKEFIDRGAAFGFQTGRPLKGANGSFISWDNTAFLALDSDGPHYFRKRYSGTTRLKIVCDPQLQASAKWDHVPATCCYDILELAPPTKGHWEFCLQLHDFGDGKLGLTIRKNKLSWKGKAVLNKMTYGPFPLEYDTSSRCCLINLDRVKTESTDFENGIFLTEDGKLVPCDPEAVNDQIQDLQKENNDRLKESGGINTSMPQKVKEQQEKQGQQQEQQESRAAGKRPRSTSVSQTRGRGKPHKKSGRDDDRGQEPAYKKRLMKR